MEILEVEASQRKAIGDLRQVFRQAVGSDSVAAWWMAWAIP